MRLITFLAALLVGGSNLLANTNHHVILITIDGLPAYVMKDINAPLRNLRMLASQGVMAEGMRVSNPSVTWPNHTTLVTGVQPVRHTVIFNGVLSRAGDGLPVKVEPRKDKSDLVAVPTLYDFLHPLGYTIGDVNWPATRNAKTLQWSFPDVPDQVTHSTPSLREELVKNGILRDVTDKSFISLSGPAKDQVWTASACFIMEKHRPNLLLFHLLITDGTHHKYAAQSPAGYVAVGLADAHVGQLIESVKRAGIFERTTFIVTSDHGFERATNLLNPNALFRKAGLLEIDQSGTITKAKVQSISEGGTALVYFTNPASKSSDREKVLAWLRQQRELAEILEPDQYQLHGYPDPAKYSGMADLVLIPREGYAFSNSATVSDFATEITPEMNQGFHGYISTNPKMNAAFIAAGRGIKKGKQIGIIDNIDIAPTIAALFGRQLPNASGRVLKEILD